MLGDTTVGWIDSSWIASLPLALPLRGFGQSIQAEGALTLTLPAAEQWARAERAAAGSFLRVHWGSAAAGLS